MNVNQVKELYDNAKTFANTKSILKRTNELMSYEPVFDVHEDKYVQNFELVCNRMLSSGLAKCVYALNMDMFSVVVNYLILLPHSVFQSQLEITLI